MNQLQKNLEYLRQREQQKLRDRGALRPDGELSVSRFAKIIGITQPTLHRILAEDSKEPHDATLAPIADYYGITPYILRLAKLEIADADPDGAEASKIKFWVGLEGDDLHLAEPTSMLYLHAQTVQEIHEADRRGGTLSSKEALLIEDYRLLLDDDQQRIADEVRKLADIARAYRAKFGEKIADNNRVAECLPPAKSSEISEEERKKRREEQEEFFRKHPNIPRLI